MKITIESQSARRRRAPQRRGRKAPSGALRDLSKLLLELYAAPGDGAAWRTLAGRIAGAFGAASGQIGIWSPIAGASRRLSWTANYTAELLDAYRLRHHRHDPWVARLRRSPVGAVADGDLASVAPGFLDTPLYNDYCRPLGLFHVLAAQVAHGLGGTASVIGLHRERGARPFGAPERDRLRILVPHVRQAIGLHESLHGAQLERGASLAALERLQLGVIVADRRGALLYANAVADERLRLGDGLGVRNGRLYATSPSAEGWLSRAIAAAAGAELVDATIGDSLGMPCGERAKLWLRVCPLPAERFADAPAEGRAIVFMRRAELRPIPLQAYLLRVYGLTRAEARLSEALLNGATLAEFSKAMNVSINTAKTLRKRALAKTGHPSRSRLLRDLLGNPFLAVPHPRN